MEVLSVASNCELLGQSQTLLGVLLTLAVLCIFSQRSSNYILNIWISQSERSTSVLDGLLTSLKNQINSLNNSENYLILQKILKGDIPCDAIGRNKAVQFLFNINVMQKMDNIDFNELKLKTESLAKYNEQYIAPLYSFLYGIIIFIADEIFRLNGVIPEWSVFAIYMFTILSIAYFVSIWMVFLNHPVMTYRPSRLLNRIIRYKNRIGNVWTTLIILFMSVLISDAMTVVLSKYLVDPSLNGMIWTVIAIALPIMILGWTKILVSKSKGNYSTLHVLGHLLVLLLLALSYTGSLKLLELIPKYSDSIQGCFNCFNSLPILRFTIVMFVLLNAVLLPLFLPLIKVGIIKRPYSKELKTRIKRVEEFSKQMDEELPIICQSIVRNMATVGNATHSEDNS